jgi:hypothetical protein
VTEKAWAIPDQSAKLALQCAGKKRRASSVAAEAMVGLDRIADTTVWTWPYVTGRRSRIAAAPPRKNCHSTAVPS